jgi:HEPN domain-containing protein
MTQEKSIQLWQEGAKESLRVAHILLKEKSYALCLFHCHLASEKAMKGKYIAEKNTAPPKTHALDELAMILDIATPDTLEQYAELSDMAVQARYGDEGWGTTIATAEECKRWLQFTEEILQSSFL